MSTCALRDQEMVVSGFVAVLFRFFFIVVLKSIGSSTITWEELLSTLFAFGLKTAHKDRVKTSSDCV